MCPRLGLLVCPSLTVSLRLFFVNFCRDRIPRMISASCDLSCSSSLCIYFRCLSFYFFRLFLSPFLSLSRSLTPPPTCHEPSRWHVQMLSGLGFQLCPSDFNVVWTVTSRASPVADSTPVNFATMHWRCSRALAPDFTPAKDWRVRGHRGIRVQLLCAYACAFAERKRERERERESERNVR